MDRKNPFKSTKDADNWLTDYLLSRNNATSNRLLNTTKLTDLIYRSFSFEDVYYGNSKKEKPINIDSLAADLFGALFSPLIRRKSEKSVNLRERTFNRPIFDNLVTDDRFDTLKKLCEDKELISYEAASNFAKALDEALDNKPYTPKVYYIEIIEMLSKQIDSTINRIRQFKDCGKTDKLMPLYKRVWAKLIQIDELTAKLKEDALLYINSLSDDFNNAIEVSVEKATETHCIMMAWGSDSGEMKNTPCNRELVEHVKNSGELLRIAKSLGKYREIIADKRKNGFAYGRGEKYDLTTGNAISNCLSSELGLLGTPETEILFMRKYEQKRLQQYRKRTEIIKGKGDMIVLIDESGSTAPVQAWAKAFALALLDIAAKDNRKFAMVHFASASNIKTDLFEPGHYTSADVLKAAEQFFGGGTDFETPLTEAINLMEKGYEEADITIITDGECRISDKFADRFRDSMRKYKATVTGILLDKDRPCGESLEPFCDKIYHSKKITEDAIAVQILSKRAS